MNPYIITSVPINPPWDQGDKNLAYLLTQALPHIPFRVLTCRGAPPPPGDNLIPEPLYSSRNPGLLEKIHVYRSLLSVSQRASLIHFFFRPYTLSSWSIRWTPAYRRLPTLHTLPATADGNGLHPRLLFSDRLVAVSEYGQCALKKMGFNSALYIPPGIDWEHWFELGEQMEEMKAQLGFSGHPVILFTGHYGPGQGADTLFQALPALLSDLPSARVIYACRLRSSEDMHLEGQIRSGVKSLGLEQAVRFYNHVEDMRSLIAAADVVALPLGSMRDKLDIPITLLEAMAAGKPVVISDIPPMNEIFHHARAAGEQVGRLVPPEDAAHLASALTELLTDPNLCQNTGRNGSRLVEQHYNIRDTARQYEQLYLELSQ